MGQKNSKIVTEQKISENDLSIHVDMLINIPSGIIFKKLKFNRKKMSGLDKFYCFSVDNTTSNLLVKNPVSFNLDICYIKTENGKTENTKKRQFYPNNYKYSNLHENLGTLTNIINNKRYTDIIDNQNGIILRHTYDSKMQLLEVIIKINQ